MLCTVPYIGSELQVLLPLPQVLGLKVQAESTTPWLTVKRQTETNLGIPGKKGSWFHRSLLLLTKCTKVISSSPPCRVSTQTGSGQLLQGHNSVRTCRTTSQSGQAPYEIKKTTKTYSYLDIDKTVCNYRGFSPQTMLFY